MSFSVGAYICNRVGTLHSIRYDAVLASSELCNKVNEYVVVFQYNKLKAKSQLNELQITINNYNIVKFMTQKLSNTQHSE